MKYHIPVMLDEAIEFLNTSNDGKYIDCTLGDAGHTLEILKRGGSVLSIEVNEKSLERAIERVKDAGLEKKFTSVRGNFKDIENIAEQNNFSKVNGVLFDLGFSSTQLEDEIGLTFQEDQPLDMRMDKNLGVTAADLVNALSEKELALKFSEYGGERYSKRFAKAIVKARKLKRIETTKQLVNILVEASPPGYEHGRIHPATRVFQALRILVNDEIRNLEIALPQAARLLLPGGRMVIITFHSLEDKTVKEFGRGVQPTLRDITGKPMVPTEREILRNPRARSAKMRVYEKNA